MKKKNTKRKVMAIVGTAMLLQSVAPVVASASEKVEYYNLNSSYTEESTNIKEEAGDAAQKPQIDDKWNSKDFKDVDWSSKKGSDKVPIEALEKISPLIKQIESGLYKNIKDVTFNDLRTFKGAYDKEKEIVGLDLSNQEFTKLPSILKEMKELRYLDLSKNNIEEYPQWIMDFKQLDKETNIELSKLISWGKLKPKENEQSKENDTNESEQQSKTDESKGSDKKTEGGKIYETWNRTAKSPVITTSSADNKDEKFDKYISTNNEVVNVGKDKPNNNTQVNSTPKPPVEENTSNQAKPIEKIPDTSETVKTLPQTGSIIGTSMLGILGICVAAIGGFFFKRKKAK